MAAQSTVLTMDEQAQVPDHRVVATTRRMATERCLTVAPAKSVTSIAAARPPSGPGTLVRVLDEDPELADGLEGRQRELATLHAVAPLLELPRGPCRTFPAPTPGMCAALVLEGLIYLQVDSGCRAHGELLGPGDVISPWTDLGAESQLAAELSVRVVSAARLAWVNQGFLAHTARWPQLHAALMERLILRARRLELQNVINTVPRIEERLSLTLWQLAGRFGRVTPKGVSVRLPLSHAQLAQIIAAQRPSVTCAIRRLRERGRLHLEGPEWLLYGPAPAAPPARSRRSATPAS